MGEERREKCTRFLWENRKENTRKTKAERGG
jgi:hypothetical protein